jgi:hypothetical protein
MHAYFLLSLPRLHAQLAALPEGCRTLWPGLPRCPEHAWTPELPWPPALAQACLADYERACRDGASGAPVHALGAEHAPADLSDAERRALREMAGMPAEAPEQPLRQTAQQVLLLAWLQEKQALDMAELEAKISASRRELAGLLSGRIRVGEASFLPGDRDLPDWRRTLSAALAFLPDMPGTPVFCISSPSMAQACAELDAETPAADVLAALPLPEGGRALLVSASSLATLCGRSQAERLARALSADQLERPIVLLLPA